MSILVRFEYAWTKNIPEILEVSRVSGFVVIPVRF